MFSVRLRQIQPIFLWICRLGRVTSLAQAIVWLSICGEAYRSGYSGQLTEKDALHYRKQVRSLFLAGPWETYNKKCSEYFGRSSEMYPRMCHCKSCEPCACM